MIYSVKRGVLWSESETCCASAQTAAGATRVRMLSKASLRSVSLLCGEEGVPMEQVGLDNGTRVAHNMRC